MKNKPAKTNFWTAKKAAALKKAIMGNCGFLGDYVSNFDHLVSYPEKTKPTK